MQRNGSACVTMLLDRSVAFADGDAEELGLEPHERAEGEQQRAVSGGGRVGDSRAVVGEGRERPRYATMGPEGRPGETTDEAFHFHNIAGRPGRGRRRGHNRVNDPDPSNTFARLTAPTANERRVGTETDPLELSERDFDDGYGFDLAYGLGHRARVAALRRYLKSGRQSLVLDERQLDWDRVNVIMGGQFDPRAVRIKLRHEMLREKGKRERALRQMAINKRHGRI